MNERIRQLLNEATVGLEPDLSTHTTITHNELSKFAELVKDDYSKRHARLWLKRIDDAVEEEREECAKICDRAEENWRKSWHSGAEKIVADAISNCGTNIRARKK